MILTTWVPQVLYTTTLVILWIPTYTDLTNIIIITAKVCSEIIENQNLKS